MKKLNIILIITVFAISTLSCRKDKEPSETEILIDWIWENMTDIYLWADEVDRSLYPTDETDPEAFFYSLLNEDDRFSWIVDDYEGLINSFNNIEVATGIAPYFIRRYNSDDVIAIVEYVSKGSPADSAGVKRGDIITDINGTTLNIDNYVDLFYADEVTLGFADYLDNTLTPNDRTVQLSAKLIEENPIVYDEIIHYEEEEIGYIVYTGFSTGKDDKWLDSLDYIFSDYKSKGIKNVIFDIRYNPGGYVFVADHIASVLAPAEVPDGTNVMVKYQWNSTYQEEFLKYPDEYADYLVIPFEELPGNNLDLTKVYFLTGSHSASASELTIVSLEPYMDVIQIGESTYGKFYGSISIPDSEDPPRHNWAMQPLVFKYANSLGFTDFVDGLVPDFQIDDNLLEAKQFGDLSDPLLAKALEEITGVSPLLKKQVATTVSYTPLPDPVRERKSRALFSPVNKNFKRLTY